MEPGSSPCSTILCPQLALESILHNHLKESPHVHVFWSWLACDISQDVESVEVKIETWPSQSLLNKKIIRSKWAVGCDGRASWVRRHLGIHSYGQFSHVQALKVTFQSPELLARLDALNRCGTGLIATANHRSFVISCGDESSFKMHVSLPSYVTEEEVEKMHQSPSALIHDALGEKLAHSTPCVQAYDAHMLLATKYSEGRVFLAGDSAHQWPQGGDLGMNCGMGDVADLGWKLAAVVQGWGGPELLNSYQKERRSLADQTRRVVAEFNPYDASPTLQRLPSKLLANFIFQLFFGHLLRTAVKRAVDRGVAVVLGFHYNLSNIVAYDQTMTTSEDTPPTQTPFWSLPGETAPHVALDSKHSILDLFGREFVLLCVGTLPTECGHLVQELANLGAPIKVHSVEATPAITMCYTHKYYLVRPDGVIAWRSNLQPTALESHQLSKVVCGYLAVNPCTRPPTTPGKKPVSRMSVKLFLSLAVGVSLHQLTTFPLSAIVALASFFLVLVALLPKLFHRRGFVQKVSQHSAVLSNEFGEAELLQVKHDYVGCPFGPADVLVRVHAAALNPVDYKLRRGDGAPLLHLAAMLLQQKFFPRIYGRDFSGEVVAVGDKVSVFQPGDLVYGCVPAKCQGSHAQYVSVPVNSLVLKPANISHVEAASLPIAVLTAWKATHLAGLGPYSAAGKQVVVLGGAGGVGSVTIQLLKAWGASIATTCSGRNSEFVKSLGADTVVDYTQGDFTQVLAEYDTVIDCVGGPFHEANAHKVLKKFSGSSYVSIVPNVFESMKEYGVVGSLVRAFFSNIYGKIKFRLLYGQGRHYILCPPDVTLLAKLKEMLESGQLKAVIDSTHPMSRVVEAYKRIETGHARGKVVLTMM